MAEGGQRLSRYESRTCPVCGEEFRASEPTRKYCSLACRTKASEARRRRPKQGGPSAVDVAADDPPLWEEGATR